MTFEITKKRRMFFPTFIDVVGVDDIEASQKIVGPVGQPKKKVSGVI